MEVACNISRQSDYSRGEYVSAPFYSLVMPGQSFKGGLRAACLCCSTPTGCVSGPFVWEHFLTWLHLYRCPAHAGPQVNHDALTHRLRRPSCSTAQRIKRLISPVPRGITQAESWPWSLLLTRTASLTQETRSSVKQVTSTATVGRHFQSLRHTSQARTQRTGLLTGTRLNCSTMACLPARSRAQLTNAVSCLQTVVQNGLLHLFPDKRSHKMVSVGRRVAPRPSRVCLLILSYFS